MRLAVRWLFGVLLASGLVVQSVAAGTLEDIKSRGTLRCGVNGLVPGLSFKDDAGQWSGLDTDFCRAVAAAVLGDSTKVEFIPLGLDDRLTALSEGRIELLARNTTWTLSRDLGKGMTFTGILYFDGQGFIVPRAAELLTTLGLSGRSICALAGTTSAENARRYFTRHRMDLELVTYDSITAAKQAYLEGKCEALTSDQSQLHSLRATLDNPRDHRILPEVISKEPLSPAVRKGDAVWFDIVRWTLNIMIDAEEKGIDSSNVGRASEQAKSEDTRLLLDVEGHTAALLGLEPGWSQRIIAQVGNYAEVFDRNLGMQSALKIKRGLNALWRDGGLLYAPPAR